MVIQVALTLFASARLTMDLVPPRDVPAEPREGLPCQTLLHPEIGGRMGVCRQTIAGADPHRHDELDQMYFFIRGRGRAMIDDAVRDNETRCLAHIPRGRRHALAPSDADPVTAYSMLYGTA